MARRRGRREETEMRHLLNDDGENDDADFQPRGYRVPSTVEENQENPSKTNEIQYGTFTQAAGRSTGSVENMRFVVLGSDNSLMNDVPAFILGERQSGSRPGKCKLMEGHVHDRHVSIVITPANWLERLKSFWFFKNAVKSLKNEMEFCESLVFPGPHAFLLVIDDRSNEELRLLDAIREVFGREALDYSMVLFIKQCHQNQQKANHCVKACQNRYHILNSTNQSVADLFVEVERMTRGRKSKCFINNFEFFTKVSALIHMEFKTEYEEKESKLLRKLTEMNKSVQNLQKELKDLKTEVDLKNAMLLEERQKCKALEQKLAKSGFEQALLIRGQPSTVQRLEVPEHKDEQEVESREEESQASGSQMFVRVRRGSKEMDPPNMSESRDEREGETETRKENSQISGSKMLEGLKTLRRGSKEMDPPNMSESKPGHLFVL
ncbi:GTPase IMAP family member 4 isoform X2 [Labeo rohita]|uniref:GTPase IMAP family member 4 isoform X2 n=1 Tax=Labeo rohita TaxID=84645 RepID=UPI0021E303E4|nr:GTPase IMAP family member 4 isoform X2 [Labeo rohita]